MTKNLLRTGLLFLAVVITTSTVAWADGQMRAFIPFNFEVGDEFLPAGEYTIQRVTSINPTVLMVRSEDGDAVAIFHTHGVTAGDTPDDSSLIFKRYGNRYVLSQIWRQGENLGRELRVSRDFEEVARSHEDEPFEVAAYRK